MPKPPPEITITLTAEEQAELNDDWNGSGGFQTLAPKLQAKLAPNGELVLLDEEIGSIVRYMSYVQSGFRSRVRKVFRRSVTELMNRK